MLGCFISAGSLRLVMYQSCGTRLPKHQLSSKHTSNKLSQSSQKFFEHPFVRGAASSSLGAEPPFRSALERQATMRDGPCARVLGGPTRAHVLASGDVGQRTVLAGFGFRRVRTETGSGLKGSGSSQKLKWGAIIGASRALGVHRNTREAAACGQDRDWRTDFQRLPGSARHGATTSL